MNRYKKLHLGILFLIALVICNLTACKESYSVPPQSEFQTNSSSNSVCMLSEKTEYTAADERIKYTIVNNSDMVFSKSKEDFVLQRYDDGVWKDYPFKKGREITYDWYTFELSTGETTDFEIVFKEHFRIPMDQGYYRISQFGLISNIFIIK